MVRKKGALHQRVHMRRADRFRSMSSSKVGKMKSRKISPISTPHRKSTYRLACCNLRCSSVCYGRTRTIGSRWQPIPCIVLLYVLEESAIFSFLFSALLLSSFSLFTRSGGSFPPPDQVHKEEGVEDSWQGQSNLVVSGRHKVYVHT